MCVCSCRAASEMYRCSVLSSRLCSWLQTWRPWLSFMLLYQSLRYYKQEILENIVLIFLAHNLHISYIIEIGVTSHTAIFITSSVRCNAHFSCSKHCDFGYRSGDNSCPTCQCLIPIKGKMAYSERVSKMIINIVFNCRAESPWEVRVDGSST